MLVGHKILSLLESNSFIIFDQLTAGTTTLSCSIWATATAVTLFVSGSRVFLLVQYYFHSLEFAQRLEGFPYGFEYIFSGCYCFHTIRITGFDHTSS